MVWSVHSASHVKLFSVGEGSSVSTRWEVFSHPWIVLKNCNSQFQICPSAFSILKVHTDQSAAVYSKLASVHGELPNMPSCIWGRHVWSKVCWYFSGVFFFFFFFLIYTDTEGSVQNAVQSAPDNQFLSSEMDTVECMFPNSAAHDDAHVAPFFATYSFSELCFHSNSCSEVFPHISSSITPVERTAIKFGFPVWCHAEPGGVGGWWVWWRTLAYFLTSCLLPMDSFLPHGASVGSIGSWDIDVCLLHLTEPVVWNKDVKWWSSASVRLNRLPSLHLDWTGKADGGVACSIYFADQLNLI